MQKLKDIWNAILDAMWVPIVQEPKKTSPLVKELRKDKERIEKAKELAKKG